MAEHLVDLRSDTLTMPTPEMRRAMAEAELGDDVFHEDPTVNRLEAIAAERLGKDAAVLVTSGTQGTLAGVVSHTQRGDEVICGDQSHVFHYEVAGCAVVGSLQMRTVPSANGMMDPEAVRAALQKLSFLVVQDTRVTETSKLAHVVLPGTHFGEKEGTYTNRKGRVQKLNAALIPPEGAFQDSEIFARFLELTGEKNGYGTPQQIFTALAREISAYQKLTYDSIGAQGIELGSAAAEHHDR